MSDERRLPPGLKYVDLPPRSEAVRCPACGAEPPHLPGSLGCLRRQLAQVQAEVERLRREREALVDALMPASEALADLDKGYYRIAKQDPGGYVMGSVSVASLVTAIEATRKALALLDGEKGRGEAS